jgi:hypothetical protein
VEYDTGGVGTKHVAADQAPGHRVVQVAVIERYVPNLDDQAISVGLGFWDPSPADAMGGGCVDDQSARGQIIQDNGYRFSY